MDNKVMISQEMSDELLEFYRECIRTKSFSDQEGDCAKLVVAQMKKLDFDEAYIDSTGNAVGRVGNGPTILHFDSHMDTVLVNDAEDWIAPPFAADIVDGKVYGRGTVDMKGGLCASLYAAAFAKKAGLLEGKTVYITGSVNEEYCDGVNLEHFYAERNVRPDFCVICEPSDDMISLGHNGKLQARIITDGVSAHGSAPEKGVNAVYEMAEIISRVDALSKKLLADPKAGSIVLSDISCTTASLNAVPNACEIYLDRRLKLGETLEQARGELDELVRGKNAHWEPGTLIRTSWTGSELRYEPAHDPWKISEDHILTRCCNEAYESAFGEAPNAYDFWDYSTNGVTPIRMGISTIGFGPGVYKLAHMCNEHCEISKLIGACNFYANLIRVIRKEA